MVRHHKVYRACLDSAIYRQSDSQAVVMCQCAVEVLKFIFLLLLLQAFMQKCQEISFKVLSCFALGLGFDEDFFTKVRSHGCHHKLLQLAC